MFKRLIYLTLITFFSALLPACGGGGGTPPPPAVPAEPTLSFAQSKVFRFTWIDVSDATFYRLLENADGGSGFTQVGGDIPQGTEIFNHIVPLYARINAQYILQSCNDAGCTDFNTLTVSNTLVGAIGYLKASNTGANDGFGRYSLSLSTDRNTLAVGAPFEDSNATGVDGDQADDSETNSGAVYVFTRSAGLWSQQAYLKANFTDPSDQFGIAVSLSADGDVLAVGANWESSNATDVNGNPLDDTESFSGAVYVFTRSSNLWQQQAYLKASNTESTDIFGASLSLSGNGTTLAVAATGEDSAATDIGGNQADNTAATSGAVYVFTFNNGIWSPQAYLKASNTGAGDRFGTSVSLDAIGNTLAVGARNEDSDGNQGDNSESNSGAVYVFGRLIGFWSQQAYLKASNIGSTDRFGSSVSLSADSNTLAVGAPGEDSSANGESDNSAAGSGAVYIFTRSGGIVPGPWTQQAFLKASTIEANDEFGTELSLSTDGSTLAVGAPAEASNAIGVDADQADNSAGSSGAVYVFTRNSGLWGQQAYLKASNTDPDDGFGGSLSLGGDGNTLAVGAGLESSNAIGMGGDQADNSATFSGAVYLY